MRKKFVYGNYCHKYVGIVQVLSEACLSLEYQTSAGAQMPQQLDKGLKTPPPN